MVNTAFEIVELHDADVDSLVLSSSDIVIKFSSIMVCQREEAERQGCWLYQGRLVARGVHQIAMSSPGGLAEEGDCLYSATFIVQEKEIDVKAVIAGASECNCTFCWAISGTKLQFHAEHVQLEIDTTGRRLGTWDPTTQTMRE